MFFPATTSLYLGTCTSRYDEEVVASIATGADGTEGITHPVLSLNCRRGLDNQLLPTHYQHIASFSRMAETLITSFLINNTRITDYCNSSTVYYPYPRLYLWLSDDPTRQWTPSTVHTILRTTSTGM